MTWPDAVDVVHRKRLMMKSIERVLGIVDVSCSLVSAYSAIATVDAFLSKFKFPPTIAAEFKEKI